MSSRPHAAPQEISADRSAETRARILEAALKEFSAKGLAGARTEQIAAAAGVNKALLYYYFASKEKLYLAAIEVAAERVRDQSMAVLLLREASPGERIVRTALAHFDRLMTQSDFQTLMQQEMMRVHQGEEGALPLLVKSIFGPLHITLQKLVGEGIASGELIDVDWMQIPLATMGANVFYFLSAPVWRLAMAPFEPFALEALRARRMALVEFLGKALFMDRQRGAEISRRVLADTPMPEADASFKKFEGKAK